MNQKEKEHIALKIVHGMAKGAVFSKSFENFMEEMEDLGREMNIPVEKIREFCGVIALGFLREMREVQKREGVTIKTLGDAGGDKGWLC